MRYVLLLLVVAAFVAIAITACSHSDVVRPPLRSATADPGMDRDDLHGLALGDTAMSWGQIKHHYEDYTQAPPPDSGCGPPPEW